MSNEKILLIETALKGVMVGLAEKRDDTVQIISSASNFDMNTATTSLPSLVEQVLRSSDLSLPEVDCLGVSNGPGSFTGIKIGLAYGLGWKRGDLDSDNVTGISSLGALARYGNSFFSDEKNIAWFLKATHTSGYLALLKDGQVQFYIVNFDQKENKLSLLKEGTREEVSLDILDDYLSYFVLPWKLLEDYFKVSSVPTKCFEFSVVAAIVLYSMARELFTDDRVGDLEPKYMRRSAPEEKLITQNGGSKK